MPKAVPVHTALRWAYLVLWAIPAFAMYGFVAAAPGFFTFLGGLVAHGPNADLLLLKQAFRFRWDFSLPWQLTSGCPTGAA